MKLKVLAVSMFLVAVGAVLAPVANLGIGNEYEVGCAGNHTGPCKCFLGMIGATPFTNSDKLITLIAYSDEIGLTDAQLEEIRRMRLEYVRHYFDLYPRWIYTAFEYENALRSDDYEGIKRAVDKDLAIYKDIGHRYVKMHQAAYSMLSEEQIEAFQRYSYESDPEVGALLSGTPFTPPTMFTWHLTLAHDSGFTESQVERIKGLRRQYHERFLKNHSQLTRLESEFEQIMSEKEIDMDLAFTKIDQILDLYRDQGYTYADLIEQLCDHILTEEQINRFWKLYNPHWRPVMDALKEILEKGYCP